MEELIGRVIGKRLKEARLAASLRHEDVVAEIGGTRQRLSSWEAGKTSPTVVEFARLLSIYHTDPREILYGREMIDLAQTAVCKTCKTANGHMTLARL